ncbi:hypothetical protein GH714_027553 [Hevea brasiliensis]|uniref:TIR domain-containing protein n=1 Tax=Hevea brasiliensis TaxID=3981 RepID=A0A6A6NJN7_HEVBR|nr:hypothetical protein GH714_027553 [Hevea brasiliensis]
MDLTMLVGSQGPIITTSCFPPDKQLPNNVLRPRFHASGRAETQLGRILKFSRRGHAPQYHQEPLRFIDRARSPGLPRRRGNESGDEIAPSLLDAIEDSAASIIMLSPNYANSHWCLEELATICQLGRLILPVFYDVDPSNVRKQTGHFEKDFSTHTERFGEEKVKNGEKLCRKLVGFLVCLMTTGDIFC